jgi:NAD(P)-dependent dehydrogenase (short-subunit alcohol dehydrogenase family)
MEDFSTEVFDRILKTNLYATFWLSKSAMSRLPAGGSIINTAAIQGYEPAPYLLPYATTKSALLGFTKGLAKSAIENDIRVNPELCHRRGLQLHRWSPPPCEPYHRSAEFDAIAAAVPVGRERTELDSHGVQNR